MRVNPPDSLHKAFPAQRLLDVRYPLRRVEGKFNESLLGNLRRFHLLRKVRRRLAFRGETNPRQMTEHGFLVFTVVGPTPFEISFAERAEDVHEIADAENGFERSGRLRSRSRGVAAGQFDFQDARAAALHQWPQRPVFIQKFFAVASGQLHEIIKASGAVAAFFARPE